MMNLYVQDLLNDFEYEVKQGHYKKMDYQIWRSLNIQRSSPVEIQISKDLYSAKVCPEAEITLTVGGMEYVFDAWDRSFGEFLNEFMNIELNSKPFDTLSAATASASNAIKSSCDALNELNKAYKSYGWDDDAATSAGISNKLYKKQPIVNSMKNRKENNNMNLFKNVDFGSCENDNVKMSIYGVAVKNAAGAWVSYDSKSGSVIDVDILNFSAKYLYKMPVAIKDIAVGDTVIHCRKPMFVTKIEDGKLLVIDPAAAEEKIVLPVKSPFGFDVYTKIVNLFGNLAAGASEDSPLGNMLPLMLLADGDKTNDMFPLIFAMSGGKFDMSNPMMLYFLMKDKGGSNDMLPLLLMNNYQNFFGKCDCDREG